MRAWVTTMSHVNASLEAAILRVSVDTLVAEHGKWRVVMAAIKTMVRGRRQVQTIRPQDLPPSIRRDIGLPTVVDPPRMPTVMMVYARP
ncbi:hypothetical protein [Pelagibacterium luteolum]|uniref:Uncharacterized protein n=1 Tax=Pelagibacterium luteolum TaxID=440168 RepID=A0A1G7U130_9HYPH|nr:hypothetical protein [Pelagibacterium luteolum]SDG41193.1 hypothetical protein SAMN04487974_102474 [Pelagibacterium luteolum]